MKPRNAPRKPQTKPRGGRPAKAAAAVTSPATPEPAVVYGVDPALVDPKWILAGIAVSEKAPAAARVAACRALMLASGDVPPSSGNQPDDLPTDELSRRTLEIMRQRGKPNCGIAPVWWGNPTGSVPAGLSYSSLVVCEAACRQNASGEWCQVSNT